MINEKDYWIGVRDNAVKAVCNLLTHGGNYRCSLSDAIGRDTTRRAAERGNTTTSEVKL